VSSFWSLWISVLTIITIIGVLWVLLANRKVEKHGEDMTTGHVYDGIEEYDNPLPAWWMNMFLLTIFFAVVYMIAYPGMGNYKGMLNWTQIKQWEKEVAEAETAFMQVYQDLGDHSIEGLAANEKAAKMGQRLFANNCSVCHGSDARGAVGYPNLRDGAWLYGGEPAQIMHSIKLGRNGVMPAWGPSLGDEKTEQVTDFVIAMSQGKADDASVAAGKGVYSMFCIACHGPTGDGNIALGAPKFNDDIWLYGGSREAIEESIRNGRTGKMPAHEELLSAEKLQLLGAYVYGLNQ